MKRLIALLIALVFLISIFAPPVSAICPNPNDARFVRGGTPYGDEGAWNDLDFPGDNKIIYILGYFELSISKYLIIYVVPQNIEKDKCLDKNDRDDLKGTDAGRRTSPR